MSPHIIGVRFTKVGKIYHFDTSAIPDVGLGEHVIVDTSRGKHLGEVVQIVTDAPDKPEGGWRSVERRATPRDLLLLQSWQSKQTEAMINCRARSAELGLQGVKIVANHVQFLGKPEGAEGTEATDSPAQERELAGVGAGGEGDEEISF